MSAVVWTNDSPGTGTIRTWSFKLCQWSGIPSMSPSSSSSVPRMPRTIPLSDPFAPCTWNCCGPVVWSLRTIRLSSSVAENNPGAAAFNKSMTVCNVSSPETPSKSTSTVKPLRNVICRSGSPSAVKMPLSGSVHVLSGLTRAAIVSSVVEPSAGIPSPKGDRSTRSVKLSEFSGEKDAGGVCVVSIVISERPASAAFNSSKAMVAETTGAISSSWNVNRRTGVPSIPG